MCGIAGVLGGRGSAAERAAAMVRPIAHRGPDGEAAWADEEAGIGLGHRRLAIVDLSEAGAQPMQSHDGRYLLSFNGEIYNHRALRQELDSHSAPRWRGHSDTETLLEAIARLGLEAALQRSAGMVALALWDRQARRLHLARDRFGEKPLYYGWSNGAFLFGSELKALRAHPGFDNPISREAVAMLAARSYVPAPLSIHRRVFKLQPGCILSVAPEVAGTPLDQAPVPGDRAANLSMTRYWDYGDIVRAGLERPFTGDGEAREALETALALAVREQSVADVPVGAFLSSGIDSAAVVAMYRKHGQGAVRTFTIGFEDQAFDEAPHARAVAAHLGTDHHEHYVGVGEAQDVIPLLPTIYDEPFADSSQIPTFLVSRFARQQVTVALSGDGGDELFGGYDRYVAAQSLWDKVGGLPRPARSALGSLLEAVPAPAWDRVIGLLPGRRAPNLGVRLQRLGSRLRRHATFDEFYASLHDEWTGEDSPGGRVASVPLADGLDRLADAPLLTRMMAADALSYLPDDILCKVDRAGMAVSLESRMPLLDHRVAAVAARIPGGMKIRDGVRKHILRDLLFAEVPRHLFDRPKQGFGVPVGSWLKGPLRDWAEDLLDPRRMAEGGHFDPAPVRRRWDQHLRGERDFTASLWTVLMFEAWRREQASPGTAATAARVAAAE